MIFQVLALSGGRKFLLEMCTSFFIDWIAIAKSQVCHTHQHRRTHMIKTIHYDNDIIELYVAIIVKYVAVTNREETRFDDMMPETIWRVCFLWWLTHIGRVMRYASFWNWSWTFSRIEILQRCPRICWGQNLIELIWGKFGRKCSSFHSESRKKGSNFRIISTYPWFLWSLWLSGHG